jgi:hypothetical protein
MAIKYVVVKSPFPGGKYFIRTISGDIYTLDAALEDAEEQTALTKTELRGAMHIMARLRDRALLDGKVVDYEEMGVYELRGRGTLEEKNAPLKNAQTEACIHLHQENESDLQRLVVYERVVQGKFQPEISSFIDAATKQKNTVYTAGATAQLNGEFLSFDENDNSQGIFFLHEGAPARRASVYLVTGKKQVIFNVPDGLVGPQVIEVRTRYKSEGAVLISEIFGPLEPAS